MLGKSRLAISSNPGMHSIERLISCYESSMKIETVLVQQRDSEMHHSGVLYRLIATACVAAIAFAAASANIAETEATQPSATDISVRSVGYISKARRINEYLLNGIEKKTAVARVQHRISGGTSDGSVV